MNQHSYRRTAIWVTVLVLFIMACTCGPTVLLAKPTTSPRPPLPTDSPAPQTEEVKGLQPKVPWLIISTSDGLWAANKDGSNLVQLAHKSYYEIDLQRAISSPAHQIALVTFGQDFYHGLALQTISLPDGKLHKLTDLTTKDTEPGPDALPGDPGFEAMRAIVEQPSYAWSPDGKKLAFVGALDGPKADLYVYDLGSAKIQKVSQGDGQDFWPSWSPDGQSILYFEADTFGTGAGFSMKGIWLAAADGSGSKRLETPKSASEQMLGWRDNETAVLTSWSPGSGTTQLRLYNTRTRNQIVLNKGVVFGAAVATGIADDSGAILYNKDDGLYLLPAGSAKSKKLTNEQVASADFASSIHWEADGRIFVVELEGGKLSTFMADGAQRQDAPFNPSAGNLEVSSFGLIWGWTNKGGESEGAWISGPGLETTEILKGPAHTPAWNIDNGLLFFVGPDLYLSTFDSQYHDTAPVASLPDGTGEVLESAWMGFAQALDDKYGH